jgi:hypothetical protein
LLVITSDDGLAPEAAELVKAIEEQGGKNVKTVHFANDHSYSDHRIALESEVLQWRWKSHPEVISVPINSQEVDSVFLRADHLV